MRCSRLLAHLQEERVSLFDDMTWMSPFTGNHLTKDELSKNVALELFLFSHRFLISFRFRVGWCRHFKQAFHQAIDHRIGGRPGLDRSFPAPLRIANAPLEKLGLPKTRASTIRALATSYLEGRIGFQAGQRLDEFVSLLTELPGIGDWTAQYVAMRALSHPDAFPSGDLIDRQGQTDFRSLADYIAPIDSGRQDYMGAFVVTTGHGADEFADEFVKKFDDYNSIDRSQV